MEFSIILKAILSLIVVFCIMYLTLTLIKKHTTLGRNISNSTLKQNIQLENVIYIDAHNKIVTIKNNHGKNYIIAIGQHNSFLIDKYKIKKNDNEEQES